MVIYGSMARRKKKKARPFWLIAVCAALLAAVYLSGRSRQVEPIYPELVNGIPVYTDLVPSKTPGRPGEKREIRYLVIHETDNEAESADAKNHNDYLHQIAQQEPLSWHYTVDDHEIYHHIPDDEIAFHAGDRRQKDGGNMNGIGIELCVNAGSDYEKTLDNAAKLAAYLLNAYDLELDAVKKHQDFSGKNCPSRLLERGRWEEFLTKVDTYLSETEGLERKENE